MPRIYTTTQNIIIIKLLVKVGMVLAFQFSSYCSLPLKTSQESMLPKRIVVGLPAITPQTETVEEKRKTLCEKKTYGYGNTAMEGTKISTSDNNDMDHSR